MSRTLKVQGVVGLDAKWHRMSAVLDACVEAGVPTPKEVAAYFKDTSDEGIYTDLVYTDISDSNSDGVEVKVEDIPSNVLAVRVIYRY